MKNRLNITIDEALLEEAKKYANKQQTSLSQLVEDYFKKLASPRRKNILDLMEEMPKPKRNLPQGELKNLYYESRKKKYGF